MPIAIAAPPQHVPVFSGFDYVAVDEARHRAFAAHTGSKRLLIVDTESGNVTGQVKVGTIHGVAVDPATGFVFTGDGTDRQVSKVDPATMKVIASIDVPGEVDAIVYDAGLHRLYADQDNGSNVFVIDGHTMKQIATITMPSKDLESPTVDPQTHLFYQNLADRNAFAIVNPQTMKITKVVATAQLQDNHPLVFASASNLLVAGGKNGILSTYTSNGAHLGDGNAQPDIDQCSTGSRGRLLVCAGAGVITVVDVQAGRAPQVVARLDTGHPIHTAGIDEGTGDVWVVWSDKSGDYVQRLHWKT